jgi:hypothetical protein
VKSPMAQLADEDRIDLDASIATYLPDDAQLWAGVMRGEGLTPESRAARCKDGLDDGTGNVLVCEEPRRCCVVFLSNLEFEWRQ